MPRILTLVLALPVSLAVAFTTVGPALFADGGGPFSAERVVVVGVSVVAYLVLGAVAGRTAGPSAGWAGVLLGVPVVGVAVLFGLDEAARGLALLAAGADVAAIAGGVALGRRAVGRAG